MNRFDEWLRKLGEAWCEGDAQKAASLFSKNVEYYESVLGLPCENWNKVLDLWKAVPNNQRDVTFSFELVAEADSLAVANWKVSRTLLPANKKQIIDGIFIVKLNDENLCSYFKQWRTVKDIL